MLRNSAAALLLILIAIAVVTPLLLGQAVQLEPKREHFQNAEVLYGWAQDSRGERLRTFITRPINHPPTVKVPAIFFVGWLSCDSVEYPDADTKDGFGILLRRLIEQSGYATVRMASAQRIQRSTSRVLAALRSGSSDERLASRVASLPFFWIASPSK